ncbi:MAG: hypothetical protein B7Z14_15160 [Bosea sp. 32-68-6]|nr:MAG: hypothetical protein B7Z14_15160 [Bosea sp. 32-68-6]
MDASCRFGIEEEYFLSDAASRGIVRQVSPAFIAAAHEAFPDEVQREMLQSQIEVATPVCSSMAQARGALTTLRTGLAGLALEHDMLLLACGTHPSAAWSRQRATDASRYDALMRDLQMLGSRNQLCGLHVHVEVADEDERIRLMARIMPFLPLLLALSTSSPFWQGRRTGLMGYRLAAYGELPRTGLPDLFADPADYRAYVDTMVAAGAIKDASYLWWAIRPSNRHPTLELRIADSCTRLAAELEACRAIAAQGTSADVQLAVYEEARARAGGPAAGLAAVIDWIASETRLDRTGWGRGMQDGPGTA